MRNRTFRLAVLASVMAVAAAALVPGTASAASSGQSAAKAAVKSQLKRPTKIPNTEPLTKKVPSGWKVNWLECSIPDCAILGPPLKEAVGTFGWSTETINAGLTPETVQNAWSIAARNKPNAVVATGFPEVIFKDELATLSSNGAKVANGFVADQAGNGITTIFNGTSTSKEIGVAFANWVVAEKGSKADVLFVHSSTFPTLVDVKSGFDSRMKTLCSKCPIQVLDVPATSIGADLPQQVVAKLRSNPDINYVVADEGNMLIGLPAAMQAASINVPAVGQYPSETSVGYLEDGTIVKALIMTQQVDAMWQAADALARAAAGDPVAGDQPASPVWIVTKKTAGQLKYPYFLVPGYQAQYKKLWKNGLS